MAGNVVQFRLEADESKALQAYLRVVDGQAKAENQFKRTTEAVKKQDRQFGEMAKNATLSSANMVKGVLGIGSALGTVTAAIGKMNEVYAKAAEAAKGGEFSLGKLSQLSGGNQDEYNRLIAETIKSASETGMPLSDAGRLTFQLKSLGLEDNAQMFRDLYGTVADPAQLAESLKTTQTAFGEAETGNVRAIFNKQALAAAVSKVGVEEIGVAMAGASSDLESIGASDEESYAAVGLLTNAMGSPEQAATRISAITRTLKRKGLSGNGLIEGILGIREQTKGMSDADLLTYMGDAEGAQGFNVLNRILPEVYEAAQNIDQGNFTGPGDVVDQMVTNRRNNPMMMALERSRVSERAAEMAQMGAFGSSELNAEADQSNLVTQNVQRGESAFEVGARNAAVSAARFFTNDKEYLQATDQIVGAGLDLFQGDTEGAAKIAGTLGDGISNIFESEAAQNFLKILTDFSNTMSGSNAVAVHRNNQAE